MARRLEAFVRLFTAERERQQEAVAHALDTLQEWPLDVYLVHYGNHCDSEWEHAVPPRGA